MLHYYFADTPPSTGKIAPVVQDESSVAKYNTALATSSAVPIRPRGCSAAVIFRCSLVFNQSDLVMSVSITAAQTQFTRILFLAYSKAHDFVRSIIAAFAATYAVGIKIFKCF